MQKTTTLYWTLGSQPSRAVKALLDIGKIPYNLHTMDLVKKENKNSDYLSKNPFGQVPFIRDQQMNIGVAQSNAIMVYLTQRYPQLDQYYAKSLLDTTKMNEYLSWYQGSFRPALMQIIWLKKYRWMDDKKTFSQNQFEIATEKERKALKALNEYLKGQQYIALNRLTILDLLYFFETSNIFLYGHESFLKENENVNEWYKRVEQVPQVNEIQKEWKEKAYGNFKKFLDSIKPDTLP